MPNHLTSLPVGAMPRRGPLCVPRAIQRAATLSAVAKESSTVTCKSSGKAVRNAVTYIVHPAMPWIALGRAWKTLPSASTAPTIIPGHPARRSASRASRQVIHEVNFLYVLGGSRTQPGSCITLSQSRLSRRSTILPLLMRSMEIAGMAISLAGRGQAAASCPSSRRPPGVPRFCHPECARW